MIRQSFPKGAAADTFGRPLYSQRINIRTTVGIYQLRAVDGDGTVTKRANFLSLIIVDEFSGRWIILRLSTMRKIIKFLVVHALHLPRRLKEYEQRVLDKGAGK